MHNYMQLKLYSKYMIISITKYLNVKWPGKHGHFIFYIFISPSGQDNILFILVDVLTC